MGTSKQEFYVASFRFFKVVIKLGLVAELHRADLVMWKRIGELASKRYAKTL